MKKQNTLVSILIINYNNEKFVSRAINSCLTQNYKNVEILIHDDKSMEDSIKKINKFKKNKKVKILINRSKKKNISSFDAMNGYLNLFKKSKGKIICLLDSDDFFHKSKSYFSNFSKYFLFFCCIFSAVKPATLTKQSIFLYFFIMRSTACFT